MSVFEQTNKINIKDICFDEEYTLKFISGNDREIFNVLNPPVERINELVKYAQELIETVFYIEYRTPTLKKSLYINLNGFCTEPFKFNSKYLKRNILAKNPMAYRLGYSAESIIKKYTHALGENGKSFVQTCLLNEFYPNFWVKGEFDRISTTSDINDKDFMQLHRHDLQNTTAKQLDLQARSNIINKLQTRFPNLIISSTQIRNIKPSTRFSHFYAQNKLVFKNKEYSNWYSAFIEHVKTVEGYYDGNPRPTVQKHINDRKELLKTFEKIETLEGKMDILRLQNENASESIFIKNSSRLNEYIERLNHLRLKKKEFSVRDERQLRLLESKYLYCENQKSQLIKKLFNNDINELLALKDCLYRNRSQIEATHKQMEDLLRVPFIGYRIDNVPVLKGNFDLILDPSYINRLYSKNVKAFEGVIKICFEMPDGKKVWHIPNYIEENARRVDTKGVFINFDVNVFDWLISQEQTRHNMIIQAVLNQFERVFGEVEDGL